MLVKAGKYMSMDKGPMADKTPSTKIILVREDIRRTNFIFLKPLKYDPFFENDAFHMDNDGSEIGISMFDFYK